MYLPVLKKVGSEILALRAEEIHLLYRLKANFLMGNDVLGPENSVLDIGKHEMHIGRCKLLASITT